MSDFSESLSKYHHAIHFMRAAAVFSLKEGYRRPGGIDRYSCVIHDEGDEKKICVPLEGDSYVTLTLQPRGTVIQVMRFLPTSANGVQRAVVSHLIHWDTAMQALEEFQDRLLIGLDMPEPQPCPRSSTLHYLGIIRNFVNNGLVSAHGLLSSANSSTITTEGNNDYYDQFTGMVRADFDNKIFVTIILREFTHATKGVVCEYEADVYDGDTPLMTDVEDVTYKGDESNEEAHFRLMSALYRLSRMLFSCRDNNKQYPDSDFEYADDDCDDDQDDDQSDDQDDDQSDDQDDDQSDDQDDDQSDDQDEDQGNDPMVGAEDPWWEHDDDQSDDQDEDQGNDPMVGAEDPWWEHDDDQSDDQDEDQSDDQDEDQGNDPMVGAEDPWWEHDDDQDEDTAIMNMCRG
jgi:hypothetical protein